MRLPYREELTPVSFLERAGVVHADRVAVLDGEAVITWAEFTERSRRFASALRASGLRHGDRVAFVALNSEPLLLANFAVLQAGGVLVPVNTRLNANEIDYLLRHSGSRFVFVSKELAALVPQARAGIEVIVLGPDFERFIDRGSAAPVESWLECEDELCAINYTSGAT